jgi:hypothetical protein
VFLKKGPLQFPSILRILSLCHTKVPVITPMSLAYRRPGKRFAWYKLLIRINSSPFTLSLKEAVLADKLSAHSGQHNEEQYSATSDVRSIQPEVMREEMKYSYEYNTEALIKQSTDQEKIPSRNSIYAHEQDFTMSDELLLAILKAFVPQQLNKQHIIGFHVFTYTRHI